MTEAEITTQLAAVNTAITNLLLTGKEYEVGTGSSKRIFRQAELPELRALRSDLEYKLAEVQGNSGVQLGY